MRRRGAHVPGGRRSSALCIEGTSPPRSFGGRLKYFIGFAGLLVAGVIGFIGLGIAALALLGSRVLVSAILVLVGLILVAVALPFLVPIAVPVALLVGLIIALRPPKPGNIVSNVGH